ncbi:MAG TPA: hypothetical protein VEG37_02100 [Burkholderiales bacterium]|nr:hypothetical protein [Burkholderiales bacterium]
MLILFDMDVTEAIYAGALVVSSERGTRFELEDAIEPQLADEHIFPTCPCSRPSSSSISFKQLPLWKPPKLACILSSCLAFSIVTLYSYAWPTLGRIAVLTSSANSS